MPCDTLAAAVGGEGFGGGIVQQSVFVADVAEIEPCRRIICDFYGSQLPATSYIPQPPCDGKLLGIEALAVTGGQSEVEIEHHSEQLVVARHNSIAWAHAVQIVPQPTAGGVYDAATNVFRANGFVAGQPRRRLRPSDPHLALSGRDWPSVKGLSIVISNSTGPAPTSIGPSASSAATSRQAATGRRFPPARPSARQEGG